MAVKTLTAKEIIKNEPKVEIYIPIVNEDRTPVYASIGDYECLIRKGEYVTVPRSIANMVRQSLESEVRINESVAAYTEGRGMNLTTGKPDKK